MKPWLTYILWSAAILMASLLLIRYYIDWEEIALWVGTMVGLITIPIFILLDYFFLRRKVRSLFLLGILRAGIALLVIQLVFTIADNLK